MLFSDTRKLLRERITLVAAWKEKKKKKYFTTKEARLSNQQVFDCLPPKKVINELQFQRQSLACLYSLGHWMNLKLFFVPARRKLCYNIKASPGLPSDQQREGEAGKEGGKSRTNTS